MTKKKYHSIWGQSKPSDAPVPPIPAEPGKGIYHHQMRLSLENYTEKDLSALDEFLNTLTNGKNTPLTRVGTLTINPNEEKI